MLYKPLPSTKIFRGTPLRGHIVDNVTLLPRSKTHLRSPQCARSPSTRPITVQRLLHKPNLNAQTSSEIHSKKQESTAQTSHLGTRPTRHKVHPRPSPTAHSNLQNYESSCGY